MLKALPIVLAVCGLVAAGVYEGLLTNRWGSEEARADAGRLADVPLQVGPWRGTDRPMDAKVLKVTEAVGHLNRSYVHEKTGEALGVLILSGPSGPIGAHPPTVCYADAGYTLKDVSPLRRTVAVAGEEPMSYWSARFDKPQSPNEPGLQVCWAWGIEGQWSASDAPRREFMLRSSLNKLYVTRALPPAEADPKRAADSIDGFLTQFLPAVKKALAPPPA